MKEGKNSLAVGDNSSLNITENLDNVTTIKVGNGTTSKKASLNVAAINTSSAKNSITIGNYAELIVNGSLVNDTDDKGKTGTTAIKAGKNSTIAFNGSITGIESVTSGDWSAIPNNVDEYTFVVSGNLIGTDSNNKFAWGKNSKVAIGNVHMLDGNNSFTIGATSIVNIYNNLEYVSTLKIDKAAELDIETGRFVGVKANITVGDNGRFTVGTYADGVSKLNIGKNAFVNIGQYVNGNKATISLGQNANMTIGDSLHNVNKLSLGKEGAATIGGSLTGDNATITLAQDAKLEIATDITGVNKLSIGKEAEFIVKGGSLTGTKATIALDQDAYANIKNDVTGIAKLTLAKEAEMYVKAFEGNNATISLAQDSYFSVTNEVEGVSKLTLAKEAIMLASSISGTTASISLAQGSCLIVNNNVTGVNKLTLDKEASMNVDGTIIGTSKNDSVSIGANSILKTSGFEDIESVTLGKESVLIVTNGSADINLDDINGNWTNGTIYDIQSSETAAGNYKGQLYGNEWDILAFDVTDANGINTLDITGVTGESFGLSGLTIKLAYREEGSNDWSIQELSLSDQIGGIDNYQLNNGTYAIMVGNESANFRKDDKEYDYSISISFNK